jgi:serine/threonine protein kinase
VAILNTVAQFGRYMLRSRLASAGACEVWLAEIDGAASDAAPVIFKKLCPELTQNSALVESFGLRARRASQLNHECIAKVFDVLVDHGDCGLAMEFIDGTTLRQLISAVGGAGNALPVWFAIHVARRICQALEHAHEGVDKEGRPQRVAHENLCPENVFLTFFGQVKVTDFGLSRATLLRECEMTPQASMRAPASPHPKDPQTETCSTVRQDLDGVGRVLYELLTGICPACSEEATGVFLPPSHYAPWVNAEVDQLLSRILAPEESKRFNTAAEILRTLDEYLSARRHEVTSTHIAGLVSVLFSAQCRDSAPPTMRLQEGAVELALLRSRRTTPPDLGRHESPGNAEATRSSIPAPPSSQLSRQTVPVPATPRTLPNTPPAQPAPPSPTATRPSAQEHGSEPQLENADAADNRTGPFHHDWDLALKRAREEAQATQRASGNYLTAAVVTRSEPPIDPLERAVSEFERGLEHMRRGELESAMRAWELALEFDPQHRVCRANLNLLKKRVGSQT